MRLGWRKDWKPTCGNFYSKSNFPTLSHFLVLWAYGLWVIHIFVKIYIYHDFDKKTPQSNHLKHFPYQIFTIEILKRIQLAGAELLSSVPLLRGNVRLKWDSCVAGGSKRLVREADVFSQIGQSVSTNQRCRALSEWRHDRLGNAPHWLNLRRSNSIVFLNIFMDNIYNQLRIIVMHEYWV